MQLRLLFLEPEGGSASVVIVCCDVRRSYAPSYSLGICICFVLYSLHTHCRPTPEGFCVDTAFSSAQSLPILWFPCFNQPASSSAPALVGSTNHVGRGGQDHGMGAINLRKSWMQLIDPWCPLLIETYKRLINMGASPRTYGREIPSALFQLFLSIHFFLLQNASLFIIALFASGSIR